MPPLFTKYHFQTLFYYCFGCVACRHAYSSFEYKKELRRARKKRSSNLENPWQKEEEIGPSLRNRLSRKKRKFWSRVTGRGGSMPEENVEEKIAYDLVNDGIEETCMQHLRPQHESEKPVIVSTTFSPISVGDISRARRTAIPIVVAAYDNCYDARWAMRPPPTAREMKQISVQSWEKRRVGSGQTSLEDLGGATDVRSLSTRERAIAVLADDIGDDLPAIRVVKAKENKAPSKGPRRAQTPSDLLSRRHLERRQSRLKSRATSDSSRDSSSTVFSQEGGRCSTPSTVNSDFEQEIARDKRK